MRRTTVTLALLALVTAATAACSGADANDDVVGGEDFGHIHALGVDPGTEELYAATHYGLYRIDGDHTAVRVSEGAMDLMGFAIVESGRFVASGHPGPDDDGPANLGLIESADGGVTWQSRSLPGMADFHGLRAAHDTLYGYNSVDGAFMVSADGTAWEHRSITMIGSFAVSPTDPDVVLAVGGNGLQRSADGARSWHPLESAPPLTVLAWGEADSAFGVDADGTAWHSDDGGDTWQERGSVGGGRAEAAAAHGSTLLVAINGERILASEDGGQTWRARYTRA